MVESWQPKSGMASVNGTTLYYETAGVGYPLVLLHAGIADSRMWDDQWQPFSARYRAIRYDMRGFGRSASADSGFSFYEDVRALLDYLAVDRAYLVGCSMGGATAIDFTLQYPDRVAGLVLVGSGISGAEPLAEDVEAWGAVDAALARGALQEANEREIRMWVDGTGRSPEDVDPSVRQRVAEMNYASLARGLEEVEPLRLEPPAVGRLAEIRTPTLVLVGDRDRQGVLRNADDLASGIVDARKEIIAGAAHVPNMEVAAVFNRLVLDFLAEQR